MKKISVDNFSFNSEGILQPQIIQKCELAFFYNLTPQMFRQNIKALVKIVPYRRYYSVNEVTKIFEQFGYITKSDVENAIKRILDYYKLIKEKSIK